MFRIVRYERHRGVGQSMFNPVDTGRRYDSRADARIDAEAAIKDYDAKGYNGEHDYFWGWKDSTSLGHAYVIDSVPVV